MNLKLKCIALLATSLFTASSYAAPIVIDFEAGPFGTQPNGFSATGFPGVTFSDTLGADLQVGFSGFQECGLTNCLAVFADDTSGLRIDFAAPANYLSLDFGNDNPGFVFTGDLGLLTVFLAGTQVGQASTLLNIDDIMNQSVSISGVTFDSATFFYTDPSYNPRNLIEAVDNITYDNVAQVPEPASIALTAIGLMGLGFARRRQNA